MEYCTPPAPPQFARWSRRYDWDPLKPLFFRPSHRMILDALGPDVRRILDIGCGTGRFAARVLQHLPNAEVWGLDLSRGMVHRATRRQQDFLGRLQLVLGDSG